MVLVAFICFFLLVAAWLMAPSKAPVSSPEPAAPAILVPETAPA